VNRIWCERAWLGGDAVEAGVLIDVEGERIASVRSGVGEAPAGAVALPGYTLPGLANAHSHAFQRAFRGRTEAGGAAAGAGSFWTWREQMYEAAARLDPDGYRALARATFGEMALAGITAVGEFHYLHHDPDGRPYADPNEMGRAVIGAAAEAGIRITLLDTCYLRGGAGEELNAVQRRFSDGTASAWAERVDALAANLSERCVDSSGQGEDKGRSAEPSRLFSLPGGQKVGNARVGAAIHSVRAVDREAAAAVASWAAGRGAPLHAHVSEQPRENEECVAEHGMTPTALLAEVGALTGRFTAIHATHLTVADRRLLGDVAACCCLCPTTERDLADGIGGAAALRDAGASLAVGSDSQAVIDLFEEARAIELDERLASGERGRHSPAALLAAATASGHAAIGWPEAGAIAPGKLADLVSLDAGSVRLAGIEPGTALGTLAFAATAADVTNVFVGGVPIVRDGTHVSLDVSAELRAAIG
jgi:cytosine/adenosine deaminase-related metal-dependent hydrolase